MVSNHRFCYRRWDFKHSSGSEAIEQIKMKNNNALTFGKTGHVVDHGVFGEVSDVVCKEHNSRREWTVDET